MLDFLSEAPWWVYLILFLLSEGVAFVPEKWLKANSATQIGLNILKKLVEKARKLKEKK